MGVEDVRENLHTALWKMPMYRNTIKLYIGMHLIPGLELSLSFLHVLSLLLSPIKAAVPKYFCS